MPILIIAALLSGCASSNTMLSRQAPQVFTYTANTTTSAVTPFEIPKSIEYRIGIDDLIGVNIWKHPDLSTDVIVRPDGKISYLLIGDVQAAGLTVLELDSSITKKFETYAKELQEKQGEEEELPAIRKEYRIGVEDGLDISVWKVPDLTAHVIVRPDGKISYPLVGDLPARGKTLTELDKDLTERLKKYIKDPQVSIMITTFGEIERKRVTFVTEFITTFLEEKPEVSIIVKRFGSRKVIVLGQVKNPGIFDLVGNAKLLDAIAYAGDFTDTAVKDNIFIIRGNMEENPKVIKINGWDIIKRGNTYLNIPLENQDIVYAPNSIVGNINIFMAAIKPTLDNIKTATDAHQGLRKTFKLD